MIDADAATDADFAASFADIARVNRLLGGTRAVRTALRELLAPPPLPPTGRAAPPGPVRVLDIATGSADIPRALVRAARRDAFGPGVRFEIVALDNHPKVLDIARRATPPELYPEIRVVAGDAFALAYPDRAFDVALCSLAFHHFGPERCVSLLREMDRLTTRGLIVNDLLRDALACGLIWAATRAVRANRLTRHDAPLSVLRAYTLAEYRAMARAAGLARASVRLAPAYRAVILHRKDEVQARDSAGEGV